MAKAIKHTVLVVLGLLVSFTACQTDEWTAFQEKLPKVMLIYISKRKYRLCRW